MQTIKQQTGSAVYLQSPSKWRREKNERLSDTKYFRINFIIVIIITIIVIVKSYYNVRKLGSYGSVNALYKLMKLKSKRITKTGRRVSKNAEGVPNTTLHMPGRRRFPRRKVYFREPHYLWQAQLADVIQLARNSDGYRF